MGAKSLYLDNREKYKEQIKIANDLKSKEALDRGFDRFQKFKAQWETLNLDEVVNKLFTNPTYKNVGEKFIITDSNSKYIIYCDNGGSYFRIGNKEIPEKYKGHYLGSNLQSVLNETINGKISETTKARRELLSHFKMEIKKEVKTK